MLLFFSGLKGRKNGCDGAAVQFPLRPHLQMQLKCQRTVSSSCCLFGSFLVSRHNSTKNSLLRFFSNLWGGCFEGACK